MTEPQFIKIADRIRATWPAWKAEHDTLKVWYDELKRMRFEDVWAAVVALGQSEKFPPALADIFSQLTKMNRLKKGEAVSMSREERAEATAQHRKHGRVMVRLDDGGSAWEEETRAVFDKRLNCWRRKIDFVLDNLGSETVTRELKAIRIGGTTLVAATEDGKWANLMALPNWQVDYMKKLNALVQHVSEVLA